MAIYQTLTASGDSKEFTSSDDFTVMLSSFFGGGTATLHIWKGDVIGYEPVIDSDKTIDSGMEIACDGLNRYKVVLAGATSPTLNIYINGKSVLEF